MLILSLSFGNEENLNANLHKGVHKGCKKGNSTV